MFTNVYRLRGKKKAFLLAYFETCPRMSIAEACEKVGVTRQAYYNWKLRDPNFVKALECAIEEFDDKVEGWLREIMKHGDPRLRLDSIKYYADRKLKDHEFSIRKGATMSFVDSEAIYNTIQDVIRKISSEAGVPPIYFDVIAWDLKA